MAAPTLTYTLTNGTTADASQVMQNFNDLLNGITDGTKDLTINALTCNGAATLNGNVTLGNGSVDDVTFSGSIASSIPIKTTFSYDFGTSTIGLKSIYLGDAGSAARTTRIIGGSISSSYTLTLPADAGTNTFMPESNGSGTLTFVPAIGPADLRNVSIAFSVAANALTASLKGYDTNAPSSTNPIRVVFRNVTSATGTPVIRSVNAATTLVISSGSTLGFASGVTHYAYWYLIDNAGTAELAVSHAFFDEGSVVSTTAEGGAGGADSNRVMYSTTARTNVPCRLLCRTKHSLTTAGTWDEVPDEVSFWPFVTQTVSAIYKQAGGGTLTTGVISGALTFDTKVVDTRNAFATNTFTAPEAGIYAVSCALMLTATAGWAANEDFTLYLYKNGALYEVLANLDSMTGTHDAMIWGSTHVELAAGDTIDFRAIQNNGANIALVSDGNYNHFGITKMPGIV